MKTKFKIGDRVKLKTSFLRSIQMPQEENAWKDRGTITLVNQTEDYTYIKVDWDLNGTMGTLANKIQLVK